MEMVKDGKMVKDGMKQENNSKQLSVSVGRLVTAQLNPSQVELVAVGRWL